MKREQITAVITEDWDRKRNKNCKFLPGDMVRVKIQDSFERNSSYPTHPKYYTKYDGLVGKVFAATCGPDGKLRSKKTTWYGRAYTKYYVEFADGSVYGLHSHHLVKI